MNGTAKEASQLSPEVSDEADSSRYLGLMGKKHTILGQMALSSGFQRSKQTIRVQIMIHPIENRRSETRKQGRARLHSSGEVQL